MSQLHETARILVEAAASGVACDPIRDTIGESNIDAAYKIQDLVAQKRLEGGDTIVGRKIGLTSPAVQKQLGVNQPDYGSLFNTMEVMEGSTIPWEETMQPKVEAEIAFILGKDLTGGHISIAQVIGAIDYVVPCIEVVGSRIKDWNIKITDTIADNASASHFVIGHQVKKLHQVDVVASEMTLTKNGEKVSEGKGASCLGSPVNATWWLAKTMSSLGSPLRAGQLILAGALGPMAAVEPGDHFEAYFSGLGSVHVGFDSVIG